MIDKFNRYPVLGNIVLALFFGGGLLIFTLFVFNGHPQFLLFVWLSFCTMAVVFFAGMTHDNDNDRKKSTEKRMLKSHRGFEYPPFDE